MLWMFIDQTTNRVSKVIWGAVKEFPGPILTWFFCLASIKRVACHDMIWAAEWQPRGPQDHKEYVQKCPMPLLHFFGWKHGMFKSGLLAVAWDNFLLEGGGGRVEGGGGEGGKGGRGAVMEINASSLLSMAAHKVAQVPLRGRECV